MILLTKVTWYKNGDEDNPVEITDFERISLKLGQGSRGSTMDLTIKNAFNEWVENSQFKMSVDDTIAVFLKWATEPYTIDTNVSTDLIMIADIMNINAKGEESKVVWNIHAMDRTFVLLNKLWSKNYSNKTVPEMIKEILNIKTTGETGDGILSKTLKSDFADGSFENGVFVRRGGGYIQNVRPDNSNFPTTSMAKVYKPIYEWLDDLCQPDYTNDYSEIYNTTASADLSGEGHARAARLCIKGSTLWNGDVTLRGYKFALGELININSSLHGILNAKVRIEGITHSVSKDNWDTSLDVKEDPLARDYGSEPPAPRPYFYYIDENNNFHFEYPSQTVDYNLTFGNTDSYYIKSLNLKRNIFDVINMVIYNAGTDFFGSGILNYFYDSTTNSPKVKPVYRVWNDISEKWKKEEIQRGLNEVPVDYVQDDVNGTIKFNDKRYTATFSFVPAWKGNSVANTTALNNSLRLKCTRGET